MRLSVNALQLYVISAKDVGRVLVKLYSFSCIQDQGLLFYGVHKYISFK